MREPEEIVQVLEEYFAGEDTPAAPVKDFSGKHVLITAGPTHEYIDPVRYIGNCSTGKMGYALAREASRRGAHVTLVSGPVDISIDDPSVNVVKVTSACEMLDACSEVFDTVDIAVMAAAVADYTPAEKLDHKIKREKDGLEQLALRKNPDIAKTLGKSKKPGQKVIGFALETDNEHINALDKLRRKNLDAIVLNSLRDKGAGFGTDTNKITFIPAQGDEITFGLKTKDLVAQDIFDAIKSL